MFTWVRVSNSARMIEYVANW